MKLKIILYVTVLIALLAGVYFLFFQPEEKKGTYIEQSNWQEDNSSDTTTTNEEIAEDEEVQQEEQANKSGVPIYLKDKKVKIEELREEQQLVVRFMIDFMNTGSNETEEEYFARLHPYFDQDVVDIEDFMRRMGIDKQYLPPFEPDRKLDKIYVAGTYERENSYIVFVRTVEGEKEIDIPLIIDLETTESGEKEPTTVFGFSEGNRGKIRLFSNTDYVKEKK